MYRFDSISSEWKEHQVQVAGLKSCFALGNRFFFLFIASKRENAPVSLLVEWTIAETTLALRDGHHKRNGRQKRPSRRVEERARSNLRRLVEHFIVERTTLVFFLFELLAFSNKVRKRTILMIVKEREKMNTTMFLERIRRVVDNQMSDDQKSERSMTRSNSRR